MLLDFATISVVRNLIFLLVSTFHLGEQVRFCPLQFGGSKSKTFYSFHFGQYCFQSYFFLIGICCNIDGKSIVVSYKWHKPTLCVNKRRRSFLQQFGNPERKHGIIQIGDIRIAHIFQRFRLFIFVVVQDINSDRRLCSFFVGSQNIIRLVVRWNLISIAFGGVFYFFYFREKRFYFCFNLIYINIAYHHNSLKIGTIPLIIKLAKGFVFKIFDHIQIANHIANRIFGAFEKYRKHLRTQAKGSISSGSPFFGNHATFGIYFFVRKKQVIGPIVHHQQTTIDQTRFRGWHITQIVNSFRLGSIGIDI